jgi:hypothetical protein
VGAELSVGAEAFDQALQVRKRRRPSLQHRAVLTGQLVHLDELGVVVGRGGPQQAVPDPASKLDERQQRLTGSDRVDPGGIARDDTGLLEAAYPIGHSRRGQVHPTSELVEGQPTVALQLRQQPSVHLIQFHRR